MRARRIAVFAGCLFAALASHVFAWEPTKPVEIIVPAASGGGADRMADLIQRIVKKHKLMPKPPYVSNKEGGLGAQGYLALKASAGDPHKLLISLSSIFTTPHATGVDFDVEEFTPVAMLAMDPFILWVNAKSPYRSAKQYIEAVAKSGTEQFKMGGTGLKQEDQIITAMIEKASSAKFLYLPYSGGGFVAKELAGGHIDSTVNNPGEGVAHWKSGKLRPLCVLAKSRLPFEEKIAQGQSWQDIPTCSEGGIDVVYEMMRGVFLPPKVSPEHVDYYLKLFEKVRSTPEWKAFVAEGALKDTFMHGPELLDWIKKSKAVHNEIMQEVLGK